MRLTQSQKRDAIVHLRLAGMRLQRDIDDVDDAEMVARNTLAFLDLLPKLSTSGQMAARRIERICREILYHQSNKTR